MAPGDEPEPDFATGLAASTSNAPRKHVSSACLGCRRRKIKCDARQPKCSACESGGTECEYGEDRRKASSRKVFDVLTAKIRSLEAQLSQKEVETGSGASGGPSEPVAGPPLAFPTGPPQYQFGGPNGVPKFTGSSNTDNTSARDASRAISGSSHSSPPNAPSGAESPVGVNNFSQFLDSMPPMASIGNVVNNAAPNKQDGTNAPHAKRPMFSNPQSSGSSPTLSPPRPRANSSSAFRSTESVPSLGRANSGERFPYQSGPDGIVSQLATRMGSMQVAEDGQLRYFGATSNLHIIHNGPLSVFRPPMRSIRRDGAAALARVNLDCKIPRDYEDSLLELYFEWENPMIFVVDREVFYRERDLYESGEDDLSYYSEVLANAMCAIGSAFSASTNPGLPEPVCEYFGYRTKTLLEIEMDKPIVATVQALVILSGHEASYTRDARGWLYSGMSARLALDLGLHLDMTKWVLEGKLTAADADVRRTTFWGAYMLDTLWSSYMGRPSLMGAIDITVGKHVPSRRKRLASPNAETGRQEFIVYDVEPTPIDYIPREMAMLCEKIGRIARVLYSTSRSTDSARDLSIFASTTRRELQMWYRSLPTELQVGALEDSARIPGPVLELHMQYHEIMILLHRPFLSSSSLPHTSPATAIAARGLCTTSALAISALLRAYQRLYTLRRINIQVIHIVFTAALIHIYNICAGGSLTPPTMTPQLSNSFPTHDSSSSISIEAQKGLQMCCQALSEMGASFNSATRALEIILCIKREWQLQYFQMHQANRKRTLGADADMGGRAWKHQARQSSGSLPEGLRPPEITPPMLQPQQEIDAGQFNFDFDFGASSGPPTVGVSGDSSVNGTVYADTPATYGNTNWTGLFWEPGTDPLAPIVQPDSIFTTGNGDAMTGPIIGEGADLGNGGFSEDYFANV